MTSFDISEWEQADQLIDLNLPLPEEHRGRFDVVLEAGTLQHVFHLPQALANIHELLAVGGRVIHGMSTSNNHVDHGFYMFSPTLFHDFHTANGYRVEYEYVFEFRPYWYRSRFRSPPSRIYRYTPGCLDHLSYGGFADQQLAIFMVATKTAQSRADVIPQQSFFGAFWEQERRAARSATGRAGAGEQASLRDRLADRLWPHFRRSPWLLDLFLLWKRVRRWVVRRLPRRMPPLVARY